MPRSLPIFVTVEEILSASQNFLAKNRKSPLIVKKKLTLPPMAGQPKGGFL
jgi:hypothetical protein